jgi:hypothetical protein
LDVKALIKHAACAAAMGWTIHLINVDLLALRLMLRIGVGMIVFAALVLLLDGDMRQIARRFLGRRVPR